MPNEDLKPLIKQRGVIKGQLTRLSNFLQSNENLELSCLEVRKNKLEEINNDWCKIQSEIELADDNTNYELDREEFENIYYQCADIIAKRTHQINYNSNGSNASENSISVPQNINSSQTILPKINIKQFNGNFLDWNSFFDTFKTLVHENNTIPTVHKFHLLKSYLIDDASTVISSLNASEENYLVAWNLLQKRFNNPRKIINCHIRALFELPAVGKDNASAARFLCEKAEMHVNALKALKQPTDWHAMLIYIVSSKLDKTIRTLWERSIEEDSSPTFPEFLSFIIKISRDSDPVSLIHKSNDISQVQTRAKKYPHNKGQNSYSHSYNVIQPNKNTAQTNKCVLCSENHFIHGCTLFLNLVPRKRLETAQGNNLCINCLKVGHITSQCKSSSCKKCNGRHNTLLHFNKTNSNQDSSVSTQNLPEPATSALTTSYVQNEVLLSTARVLILDSENKPHECRALLDAGSQSNFITQNLANTLNLPNRQINLPALGLGQTQNIIKNCIKTTITDRKSRFIASETFLILPTITGKLPSRQINRKELNIPKNLPLADPEFHKSSDIDLLLGEYIFYKLLSVGQKRLFNDTTILQKTRIGWVVSGKVNYFSQPSTFCHNITSQLNNQIERFWLVEEASHKKHLSVEEQKCELHFQKNTIRNENGSYTVCLPFNDLKSQLGDSYKTSLKRFYNLEKRFSHNLNLKHQYCEFMQEYKLLGHMTEISCDKLAGYFLPHHPVFKENSLTSKIRVVFDGSAKTDTGISLNDTLMVGATLQDTIFSLITRFRTHLYVLTADIEKMYRQIRVHDDDTIYQKIIWRPNNTDEIKIYKLNTVTYGTSSAPFLAVRCLQQLALDEQQRYPLGAAALQHDFYVDDLLTGTSTLDDLLKLKNELTQVCNLGDFKLRKWGSNVPSVLKNIKQNLPHEVHLCLDSTVDNKTLGVIWDQSNDFIKYQVSSSTSISSSVTKRIILSQIAQIFDPLGLLGPVTIIGKLFMQRLWNQKMSWDESVSQEIYTDWNDFRNNLSILNNFSVPRCVLVEEFSNIQLHCFCDASERAYGACIYVRTIDIQGRIQCRLISAKSRVAPLKVLSLPRLELCAATLLTNLYTSVKIATKLHFHSERFWSDSTIVLNWLHTSPHLLKTFVSNRVSEVQQKTDIKNWSHVSSKDNPADYISRGQTPQLFIKNNHWLQGPSWLLQTENTWPQFNFRSNSEILEQKTTISLMTCQTTDFNLFERFSSFNKLVRTVAYILRFVTNSSKKGKLSGPLSVKELELSITRIISLVQSAAFPKELHALNSNTTISSKSKILSLTPFIDNEGLLRVGGRLKYSNLYYSQKHPILLPKNNHVTKLIIINEHIKHMHSGVLATLNAVRQRYWPIDGKNQIRYELRKCIRCFRANPYSNPDYLMANLPKERFNATKPFENVGIDYCGPFFIKEKEHRNTKKLKAYVAVFICFLTKAVHLELVGNLTTESCLSAIKRFVSRRGTCKQIFTDNGTNFVGVNNLLRELYAHTASNAFNQTAADHLVSKGIQWHFSPARSPHFGGLWEAAVKSFKKHFIRVIGDTLFTYEQLNTYVAEIENILNSRPLTPLSSDPNDFTPLTPNHFLIGESTHNLPEENLLDSKTNLLSSWRHIQKLKQTFWNRWHKDYLNQLNIRSTWRKSTESTTAYAIGTLVILKDDNLPPSHWTLGRITATHPGRDNVIRVISVKTKSGTLSRSVRSVCVFPIDIK